MPTVTARAGVSLKIHLILFGLAILLPILAFSAFTIHEFARSERVATEQTARSLSRSLADNIDRDLSAKIVLLQTLSLTPSVRRGDFAQFHRIASEASEKTGNGILLMDVDGQQRVNSRVPFGTPLPKTADLGSLEVVHSRIPHISNAFMGVLAQRMVYNISVPIIIDDQVRYVLAMAPSMSDLSLVIKQTAMPQGWVATLWDRNGMIIGRSAETERFIGRQIDPHVAELANTSNGLFTLDDSSGKPAIFAVAPLSSSGWQVSIQVPADVFEAPIRRSWIWLILTGIIATSFALITALIFGTRLARAIYSVTRAADQIRGGSVVLPKETGLREANDLIGTLSRTSTELRERTNHLEFTMRELLHRTKNLLAIIQAMARQTARSSESPHEFESAFTGRLQSLSQCHDLLVQQNWHGARLRDIITAQVAPFVDAESHALTLDGPDLVLEPKAAEQLSLAFHELATNASKHGALSVPQGKVTIAWNVFSAQDAGERFAISWTEHSGPMVNEPRRRGFGRTVIERVTPNSLNGTATLAFAAEGFRWTLETALDDVTVTRPTLPHAPFRAPQGHASIRTPQERATSRTLQDQAALRKP